MVTSRAGQPPEDYASYIRDMLGQLAEMAGRSGDTRLERSIRTLAQDTASRPKSSSQGKKD
jgi:hypothetical protein